MKRCARFEIPLQTKKKEKEKPCSMREEGVKNRRRGKRTLKHLKENMKNQRNLHGNILNEKCLCNSMHYSK